MRNRQQYLYKIGQVAGLFRISTDTIRIYERMGLLVPEKTDKDSGYRYYSIKNINRLAQILQCQSTGMSLAEIGDYFNGKLSTEEQIHLLEQKKEFLEQSIAALEAPEKPKIRIQVVQEAAYFVRENMVAADAGVMYNDYIEFCNEMIIGGYRLHDHFRSFIEFTDPEQRTTNIHTNFYLEAADTDPENAIMRGTRKVILPAGKILIATHNGSFEQIADTFRMLREYAEEKRYSIGFPRERRIDGYYRPAPRDRQNGICGREPDSLTELFCTIESEN